MSFKIGWGGHIPAGCIEVFTFESEQRLLVREVRVPWIEYEVVQEFDDAEPLASFETKSQALAEAAFYIRP